MKKILKVLFAACIGLTLSSCTIYKPADPARTITVTGNGNVEVEPDLLSLTFMVRTYGQSSTYAVNRNAELSTRVIEAIKAAGVDQTDISTSNYHIGPETPNTASSRYIVTNSIDVIIRNEEINSKVIDAAIYNGANGLTNFQYLVTDNTAALRQARTLAIQDAQDAAALLAGASGCKVGNVKEIQENYSSMKQSPRLASKAVATSAVTPIEKGKVNVQSCVTITFTLE